jgi:hypothetical protein
MTRQLDPPATLSESEKQFCPFLASNGYPEHIRWITSDQIAIGDGRQHFIRAEGSEQAIAEARERYEAGLDRGLGILLHAICATSDKTIASVYVPTDQFDAENRRIKRGLKLSCPTSLIPASVIDDPLQWQQITANFRERFEIMRQSYDLSYGRSRADLSRLELRFGSLYPSACFQQSHQPRGLQIVI